MVKSKSSGKIDLLNDIMDKLDRKLTIRTSNNDSYFKFEGSSKSSTQKFT